MHQTIKDTLSVFLYKYHDTVGFSDVRIYMCVLFLFVSPLVGYVKNAFKTNGFFPPLGSPEFGGFLVVFLKSS